MPEYMVAWQTFRDNCNEDEVTAKHLVNCASWPTKNAMVLCDVGSGDGRIVGKILETRIKKFSVDEVRLVDPDGDLLTDAERTVKRTGKVQRILKIKKCARNAWPKCAEGADVVLAVHVAYLMPNGELNQLLTERPRGGSLFVVLDSPDSVFTELWSETREEYHRRVVKAHETIAQHMGEALGGARSFITATIPKSVLKQHHQADWILSILCYRNMRKDVTPDLRKKVQDILEKHTDSTGQDIVCKSICYEFLPHTS